MKGEISFWLVKLILALVGLFVVIFIVMQASRGHMDFVGWLRDFL